MKIIPVTLAERLHPFPSRTRKLSSPAPKILGGQPPGKIGRRRDISFCARPAVGDGGALAILGTDGWRLPAAGPGRGPARRDRGRRSRAPLPCRGSAPRHRPHDAVTALFDRGARPMRALHLVRRSHGHDTRSSRLRRWLREHAAPPRPSAGVARDRRARPWLAGGGRRGRRCRRRDARRCDRRRGGGDPGRPTGRGRLG